MFQIAKQKGALPFFVRAYHWSPDSCFEVTGVEYTQKQVEYFEKTGKSYGTAVGFFCRRGERLSKKPEVLNNAGVYKWNEVFFEKNMAVGASRV